MLKTHRYQGTQTDSSRHNQPIKPIIRKTMLFKMQYIHINKTFTLFSDFN